MSNVTASGRFPLRDSSVYAEHGVRVNETPPLGHHIQADVSGLTQGRREYTHPFSRVNPDSEPGWRLVADPPGLPIVNTDEVCPS